MGILEVLWWLVIINTIVEVLHDLGDHCLLPINNILEILGLSGAGVRLVLVNDLKYEFISPTIVVHLLIVFPRLALVVVFPCTR